MSVKYAVLNILLCSAILVLGVKNYEAWNRTLQLSLNVKSMPEEGKPKIVNTKTINSGDPVSSEACNLISEQNIFSPERKDFPVPPSPLDTTATAAAPKPIVRPQIILYGVTIAADYESATIIHPGRTLRNDERETLTIKVGENIGAYKVARILPDRIAMETTGDTFEVLLYDSRNPKRRIEIKPESKTVVLASAQVAPIVSSGAPQMGTPSQEPASKPAGRMQLPRPLPFNKHTYQLLRTSAVGRPSAQESAEE